MVFVSSQVTFFVGQFDLKVFDKKYHDFLASTLNDTQDSEVASASSESFQKAFQNVQVLSTSIN